MHDFLLETSWIAQHLPEDTIEHLAQRLAEVRACGGRLFFLGVGGSAANASHAVNDFRLLAGFEAYAPTDNVAELTALTNDHGWTSIFITWLHESRLTGKDAIFVLSVGGGDRGRELSINLIEAIDYAKLIGAAVFGIVGREGYTSRQADVCVKIPTPILNHLTPHAESFQSVILHLLVSHPLLQIRKATWESNSL